MLRLKIYMLRSNVSNLLSQMQIKNPALTLLFRAQEVVMFALLHMICMFDLHNNQCSYLNQD